MITEHTYHGKLYGKTTRRFTITNLNDLNELKTKFPAIPLCKLNDGCISFNPLNYIKAKLMKYTVKMQDGTVKSGYNYHKDKGDIVRLQNPYIFTCECLRGYPNTYKVEWQTKTEHITAETEINLWKNVTQSMETETNEYAEHTVIRVKLIPLHPDYLRTNYSFNLIRWTGGNVSTINTNSNEEYKQEFDTILFKGHSNFQAVINKTREAEKQ